jgi:hypothetical protein
MAALFQRIHADVARSAHEFRCGKHVRRNRIWQSAIFLVQTLRQFVYPI